MSILCPAPLPNPSAPTPSMPAAVEFRYTQTESFAPLLQELRVSLLVSTYQANKLLAVRAAGGGLSTLVRTFDRPMGLDDRFVSSPPVFVAAFARMRARHPHSPECGLATRILANAATGNWRRTYETVI